MESTLSSLHSVWHRRGGLALLALASTIGGAVAYLLLKPPTYEVMGRLILNERQLGISELSRELSQVSSYQTGESSPLATQAELIKSQRVLEQAINEAFSPGMTLTAAKPTLKQVRKGLKIKIIPATNILELSYQHQEEQVAVELLNAIAHSIVAESVREIRLEAKSVREFLEQEVPRQRRITAAAEAAENQYRHASGLVNVEEQTARLVQSLTQLETEEITLVASYQEKVAQVQQLRQLTGIDNTQQSYIGSRVGGDRDIQEIRSTLAGVESELAAARSRFTEANPIVQSLAAQKDQLNQLYQEKLNQIIISGQGIPRKEVTSDELTQDLIAELILAQAEGTALADKIDSLRIEREKLRARLDELPLKQEPLAALVRQRQEAEETLKFLQGKLEEARLAETQLLGNIRIIELAEVGSGEKKPSKKVILVLAIALGLMLAVGVVLLLEIMDNTLHDDGEIEGLLKLSLLGVLPNLPPSAVALAPPQEFLDNGRLVEPYRLLLKTLEFRTQAPLKVVIVSSAIANEGKSTVVAHLGAVSALLGRRTLIIDADLRCPQQHHLWQLHPDGGLSETLTRYQTLQEQIKPTTVEHLDLLTCGALTPHPSKLLESEAIASLLREATSHYNLVIIDTAPISSCGDAATLSHHSNGLVLITRPNITPKDILLRAVSNLKNNGAPILGVAVNGMTAYTPAYYRYPLQGKLPAFKSLQPAKPPQSQGESS